MAIFLTAHPPAFEKRPLRKFPNASVGAVIDFIDRFQSKFYFSSETNHAAGQGMGPIHQFFAEIIGKELLAVAPDLPARKVASGRALRDLILTSRPSRSTPLISINRRLLFWTSLRLCGSLVCQSALGDRDRRDHPKHFIPRTCPEGHEYSHFHITTF